MLAARKPLIVFVIGSQACVWVAFLARYAIGSDSEPAWLVPAVLVLLVVSLVLFCVAAAWDAVTWRPGDF